MITRFNGFFDLDSINQLELYLSWKGMEKDNINKIIDYAAFEPDPQSHIRFLEKYQQFIQEHIDTLRKAIQTAKELSTKLDDYLKDLDIDSSNGKNDTFKIDELQFYTSYNRGTFSFITAIVYDPYLEKNIYASFDYRYNRKRLTAISRNIGSTEQTIEDMKRFPSYLLEEIDKMDNEDSFEGVNSRYFKCEKILFDVLDIKELGDLVDIKDSYFDYFFGKPIYLMRKMNIKRSNNVIKLQLRGKIAYELTDNLISLIKTEITLKEDHQSYDENNVYYGLKDVYDSETKRLTNKKKSLIENIGIDQEELDRLVSFINLDKE